MIQQTLLFITNDSGKYPNSRLPVVLYKNAFRVPVFFRAAYLKTAFARHQWSNAWDAGVFTYHHYHSIAHEVLGFYKGSTTLQIGGSTGSEIQVEKGDILIIPAGVAHKNLGQEHAVKCIGAYPNGRDYDIMRGERGERPAADERINAVPLPDSDPFYNTGNRLLELWSANKGLSLQWMARHL